MYCLHHLNLAVYKDRSLLNCTTSSLKLSPFRKVCRSLFHNRKFLTYACNAGFLLIMLYFFGKGWEKALPSHGLWWYLNPGPFNIKEHGMLSPHTFCIVPLKPTSRCCSYNGVDCECFRDSYPSHLRPRSLLVCSLLFILQRRSDVRAASDNKLNPGVAIFTLLSSQLIGYAFAGLLVESLVYPSICFWPVRDDNLSGSRLS